jgi:hypothetical protein
MIAVAAAAAATTAATTAAAKAELQRSGHRAAAHWLLIPQS